jgi:uracil-DNA glycosylase
MIAEIGALPRVRAVVALGRIGFDAYLAYLAAVGHAVRPKPAFGHGSRADLGAGLPVLLGSYHPSRQNTNTGRLTPAMLESVFAAARAVIESRAESGARTGTQAGTKER